MNLPFLLSKILTLLSKQRRFLLITWRIGKMLKLWLVQIDSFSKIANFNFMNILILLSKVLTLLSKPGWSETHLCSKEPSGRFKWHHPANPFAKKIKCSQMVWWLEQLSIKVPGEHCVLCLHLIRFIRDCSIRDGNFPVLKISWKIRDASTQGWSPKGFLQFL